MNEHAKSDPVPQGRRLLARYLLLMAGLLLIGLLSWSLLKGTCTPTPDQKAGQVQPTQSRPEQETPAAPPAVPKAAAQSSAGVQSQIEQVLAGIKEANQKKDLSQLLSYYSPNFQQLPQRAQSISKNWKVYDYPKMEFKIHDVRLLTDNAVVAKVTWLVEAQNISTGKSNEISKRYLIRFAKESGHWRINALEKAD